MRRPLVVALLAACFAAHTTPAAADPLTAHEVIALLNAQREAHGIPGGIRERADWSDACAKHWQYMDGNLTHDEDPSHPLHTPEGAWAGQSSVLHSEPFHEPGYNVFEDAPIHLMQLLAPALEEVGAHMGCVTTWPGYTRAFGAPALYSYPGDGVGGHYPEQVASELPFVPGDFVGLPGYTETGPHIYILAAGTGRGRLTAASMTGPEGQVEVRMVDNETPRLGSYLPPGGIIIPARPLRERSKYSVTATYANVDVTLSRSFSFETGTTGESSGDDTPRRVRARLTLSHGVARGRRLVFTLRAGRPLAGRRAQVTVKRRSRRLVRALRLRRSQKIAVRRPSPGQAVRVTVRTGRFQRGQRSYSASRISQLYRAR